jgi:hypothetical protein
MVGNGESAFNCLTSSINDNKRLKTDNKSAKAKPVKGLRGMDGIRIGMSYKQAYDDRHEPKQRTKTRPTISPTRNKDVEKNLTFFKVNKTDFITFDKLVKKYNSRCKQKI